MLKPLYCRYKGRWIKWTKTLVSIGALAMLKSATEGKGKPISAIRMASIPLQRFHNQSAPLYAQLARLHDGVSQSAAHQEARDAAFMARLFKAEYEPPLVRPKRFIPLKLEKGPGKSFHSPSAVNPVIFSFLLKTVSTPVKDNLTKRSPVKFKR